MPTPEATKTPDDMGFGGDIDVDNDFATTRCAVSMFMTRRQCMKNVEQSVNTLLVPTDIFAPSAVFLGL